MVRKNDFHTVDFFRKVRDEQAAMLQDKTHEEIIAFFASFRKDKQGITRQSTTTDQKRATKSGRLGSFRLTRP